MIKDEGVRSEVEHSCLSVNWDYSFRAKIADYKIVLATSEVERLCRLSS